MAVVDNIKRIRAEDFKKEDQELVSKLASVLNQHMEQVSDAFNNGIDFTNLNQELVTLTVIVNANGKLVQSIDPSSQEESNPQFTSTILSRPIGSLVIRAINLTNPTAYTNGAPFLHFSIEKDNLFKINKIDGLVSRNKYSLTLILFGN